MGWEGFAELRLNGVPNGGLAAIQKVKFGSVVASGVKSVGQ